MCLLQCSASMDVRVGSFSDPEGLEGLAHFLGEQDSISFFFFGLASFSFEHLDLLKHSHLA